MLGGVQAAENAEGVSRMDLSTFIITVFCLTDDWLKGKKLRQRGPSPELCDSEVLTIEIVGEFLGIDTDEGLYEHFRRYYGEWFPALKGIHRTTFLRQAANLWAVKEMLWKHLLGRIRFDPEVSLIDSSPLPVCHFARAYRCRRLAEQSAFGYEEMSKQTFYGLRVHLRVCWPGVIVGVDLSGAGQCPRPAPGRGTACGHKGLGFGGQKLLECRSHRATHRQRVAFAGSLQVQEKGRATLATLVDPKETPNRNGNLSARRALQRQEGMGAGSLASNQSLLA